MCAARVAIRATVTIAHVEETHIRKTFSITETALRPPGTARTDCSILHELTQTLITTHTHPNARTH